MYKIRSGKKMFLSYGIQDISHTPSCLYPPRGVGVTAS